MLTKEQKKWLSHLSDKKKIAIIPYDPTAQNKFEKVKQKIQSVLGKKTKVLHCGATGLGISGQDEIDMYVVVPPSKYESSIPYLISLFGPPETHYPLQRTRFVTKDNGKHIDVHLVNQEHEAWKNQVNFEDYLRSNPKTLNIYRKLKEKGAGLTEREYYKIKVGFINNILNKVRLSQNTQPQ